MACTPILPPKRICNYTTPILALQDIFVSLNKA